MVTKSSTNPGPIDGRERIAFGALLFALVAAVVAAGSFLDQLQSHYSISQFLPADHQLLKADEETKKRFFLDENQPVLMTLEMEKGQGDWLETKRLRKLGKTLESLGAREGIKASISIATVEVASQSGEELAVGPLVGIKSIKERKLRVKRDRLLTPLLISKDLRRTLVVVSLEADLSLAVTNALIEEIRARFSRDFPEATVAIGGVPAIQTRLTELVKSELVRFMGLALVASCFTLLVVFSSTWSVLVPFVAILAVNVFVLAFMALAGFSMTVLAVTIPILVSVTVLCLCAHTMIRLVEEVRHGAHLSIGSFMSPLSPKAYSVWVTLKSLFLPNLLTALTTCFGFGTLLFTDVPVIREFGIAVSISIMISWLATTLLLAPLLAFLPVPEARAWVAADAGWVSSVFRFRKLATLGVVALSIVMVFVGRNLHWSARLFDDLPKSEEARVATEEIDRSLGGTIPFEVVIEQPEVSQPWNDPKSVARMDRTLGKIRSRLEVGSAVGLPDLLRQAIGNPSAKIPEKRSAIAENWFLLSMSDASPLKQFLTPDGSTARLALRLRDVPSDRLQRTMNEIVSDVSASFPRARVSTAGLATTVHHLNNELSRSLMMGFWQALGVIMLLLFFVFRSWRWTLLAILPNLVPAAVLIGVLALAKTPIKPGVALVFSIALGIAFNNTVYLLQRLRVLLRDEGCVPTVAVERMLKLEGTPCLISSLCVLAGFTIFLMSEFEINRTFGIYMLISLFFGLIGDLIFLPALIRWFPSLIGAEHKGGDRSESESDFNSDSNEHQQETEAMTVSKKHRTESKPLLPRTAVGLLAFIAAFAPPAQVEASKVDKTLDANRIIREVEQRMTSKDEIAKVKMKVVESNGASKDRELVIKRKSGQKHHALVRLKAPSDMSGIGLLSVSQGGREDQWLYMPSQRKARRVVAGNKSQKFLDTEFNLEDFSASTYSRFTNKIMKEERAPSASMVVIESLAKDKSSSYSKILTWVDLASYQIQKSEYYDLQGKLLKTMVFRNYKQFGGTWRAQTVEVRNMQNKRSTVLQVAGLQVNKGLPDRDFTQSALEDED
jgi:uncharacterized protein